MMSETFRIISALKRKAVNSEFVEDFPRAIESHILLFKWNQHESGKWLMQKASDYPQIIFNAAKKAVEEGWIQFNLVLGHCYKYGLGTAIDMCKAVACYNTYINSFRDHKLEALVGTCYHRGVYGLDKDDAKAFQLIQKAGENDRYSYILAACYYKGIGCERDLQTAADILSQYPLSKMKRVRILCNLYLPGELDATFFNMVGNNPSAS